MVKYLLFAFSDCKDPTREKEYNEWYDNVHIPDMLEVPGMIKATRWMSADEKEGETRKYLALYELETYDLNKFSAGIKTRAEKTIKDGRFSDLPVFDPPNVPRIYKQIMPEKKAKRTKKN